MHEGMRIKMPSSAVGFVRNGRRALGRRTAALLYSRVFNRHSGYMKIAKLSEIPAREIRSPHGKYHLVRQSISQALGGIKDVGTWGGGHPFDVEYFRLPPGAANFPFHAHSAQWELYIFVKGHGSVRGAETTTVVEEGQSIIFKPGETHQILNTSEGELSYLVVADHSLADVIAYPDTGKWGIKPQGKFFTLTETSYYEPGD